MNRIASVKTAHSNNSLWFDAGEFEIKVGSSVVVETARGIEFGYLTEEIFEADDKDLKKLKSDLKPVKRIADDHDIQRAKELKKRGDSALATFKAFAQETNKDMCPIAVEYLLDGKKAIFYFRAPERQDFRDLVKKLSSEFRIRVDMHQINDRDKAALVNGIGLCGQELCCARLGRCPKHVSIKMAKTQGLSLNPENISGLCDKLLCCLDYEYEDYEEFSKRAPKLKAKIDTPDGIASVVDVNMPKETIEVKLDDSDKRVKVPLSSMSRDKTKQGNRPNKISKEAWDKAQELKNIENFETVYVSSSLKGNEKLSSGEVVNLHKKDKPKRKRSYRNNKSYKADNGPTKRRRTRTFETGSNAKR